MPIQPIIKGFYSSDVDNLSTWSPASPKEVYYPLELSIGPKDDQRADLFHVLVASPEAIRSRFANSLKCRSGHHLLLVAEHDWPSIARYCEDVVRDCAADTWDEVAVRLGRHFRWEYEDYIQEANDD
jgi:hypothetical protein